MGLPVCLYNFNFERQIQTAMLSHSALAKQKAAVIFEKEGKNCEIAMLRNFISVSSDTPGKMDEVSAAPPFEGLMWRPSNVQNHQMTKLREEINAKFNVNLEDYYQFHKWSCDNYDLFWGQVWDFCKIISSNQRPDVVIDKSEPIEKVPKWFNGVKLNYAENLLRYLCTYITPNLYTKNMGIAS